MATWSCHKVGNFVTFENHQFLVTLFATVDTCNYDVFHANIFGLGIYITMYCL